MAKSDAGVKPTLEEFLRLAKRGNVIPVYREILADFETPLSAYLKLEGRGPAYLLESVEGGERLRPHSFLGAAPGRISGAAAFGVFLVVLVLVLNALMFRYGEGDGLAGRSGD